MSLHIVYGPVFSGKTEWLQQKYTQTLLRKKNLLWIQGTPLKNKENITLPELIKNNMVKSDCNTLEKLKTSSSWKNAKVIFWDDIHETIEENPEWCDIIRQTIDKGKIFYITSFTHFGFNQPCKTACSLLPFAEEIQLFRSPIMLNHTEKRWIWTTFQEEGELRVPPLGTYTLICGPMFSGKTTKLLSTARRLASAGVNILLVNHSINYRYGTNKICTHAKTSIDNENVNEIQVSSCKNIHDYLQIHNKSYKVICIDEIQFFDDALEYIPIWMEYGYTILTAGLSGDTNRQSFGSICELLTYATTLFHEHADCQECNVLTLAPFTQVRKTSCDKKNQVEVGGIERYEAVCRKHFRNLQ